MRPRSRHRDGWATGILVALAAAWLPACAGRTSGPDGGVSDAPLPLPPDAALESDSAVAADARSDVDAPPPPIDATVPDAGPPDAPSTDPTCPQCLIHTEADAGPPSPPLQVKQGLLWSQTLGVGELHGRAALSGTRVVVSGSYQVALFDLGTRTVIKQVPSADFESISSPVVDGNGNIYFRGHRLYSVDKNGNVRWSKVLEGSTTNTLGVTPGGLVVYGTFAGELIARRASDGERAWIQTPCADGIVGVQSGFSSYLVALCIGDGPSSSRTVVAATGEPIACDNGHWEGGTLQQFVAFGGEIVLDQVSRDSFDNSNVRLVDACHQTIWQRPAATALTASLVAPGPALLLEDVHAEINRSDLTLVDAKGRTIAGPVRTGRPLLAGADGRIYVAECDLTNADGPADVVGLSPELIEEWRVHVRGCPVSAILLDSGVLILPWHSYDDDVFGINLTAIQTVSPGLAKTTWPTAFLGNNQATLWSP